VTPRHASPIPSFADRHPTLTFPQARVTALQLILATPSLKAAYPRVAVSLSSLHMARRGTAGQSCIRINVLAKGKKLCRQYFQANTMHQLQFPCKEICKHHLEMSTLSVSRSVGPSIQFHFRATVFSALKAQEGTQQSTNASEFRKGTCWAY